MRRTAAVSGHDPKIDQLSGLLAAQSCEDFLTRSPGNAQPVDGEDLIIQSESGFIRRPSRYDMIDDEMADPGIPDCPAGSCPETKFSRRAALHHDGRKLHLTDKVRAPVQDRGGYGPQEEKAFHQCS